ncbi:hypothetical protein EFO75_06925 [Limosilactobacillus reuteri]|nr:hypothetical protein [Limosilactobacillus reuteri]MCT3216920.1 hypothetical protein [Limosilactobacillus reuteri]
MLNLIFSQKTKDVAGSFENATDNPKFHATYSCSRDVLLKTSKQSDKSTLRKLGARAECA